MSVPSKRRARLLRLRAIEHRVASTRLAHADGTLANLARIEKRLSLLKSGLSGVQGPTTGLALKAMSEMALRLDSASAGMVAPTHAAQTRRDECDAVRITAKRKEDGAAKLHSKTAKAEQRAHNMRSDANRPHRKSHIFLEKTQ